MNDPTVPVSSAALRQRIVRKLAKQQLLLRKNPKPTSVLPGKWYVIEKRDSRSSRIVRDYADITHAARDLDVLYGHEVIDDE